MKVQYLEELFKRVEQIEARQRADNQHDPDCQTLVWGSMGGNAACTCWLSKPPKPIRDWEPLGEDVSMHTMMGVHHHDDGRSCAFHNRLGVWTFNGNMKCLRTDHDRPWRADGTTL